LGALAVFVRPEGDDLVRVTTALSVFLAAASSGGISLWGSAVHDGYRLVITATVLGFATLAGVMYAPARLRGFRLSGTFGLKPATRMADS
jgi:hypothetical protein